MLRSERLKRVTLAKAFSLQKWHRDTHTYFQAIKQYAPIFLYLLTERTKISVCITSYMLAPHTHTHHIPTKTISNGWRRRHVNGNYRTTQ